MKVRNVIKKIEDSGYTITEKTLADGSISYRTEGKVWEITFRGEVNNHHNPESGMIWAKVIGQEPCPYSDGYPGHSVSCLKDIPLILARVH